MGVHPHAEGARQLIPSFRGRPQAGTRNRGLFSK
jgi:hypothetical protein